MGDTLGGVYLLGEFSYSLKEPESPGRMSKSALQGKKKQIKETFYPGGAEYRLREIGL